MSDLIKIFIQQQRPAFDAAMPADSSWTGLEKALDRLPTADDLEAYLMQHRCLLDTEMPTASVWQGIEQSLDKCKPGNELERFICENREELDTETPDLRVWSAVSSALPGNKIVTLKWHRQLFRAAAAIALLVTGLGAGIWYARSTDLSGMDMADVSPEYAELERYYERDITGKKEKLATFTGSQSADVMQDIDQLDQIMAELRRELASVPQGNRQQVVRAMIENYKSKTAILQRVLEHLEENQNRGKNSKLSNETKNM